MTRNKKERKTPGIGKPLYIRSEDFKIWEQIEKEADDLKIGIGTFICMKWSEMKNGKGIK